MTVGNVFHFFIDIISRVFTWFYNLSLPVSDTVSIPLGSFLISIVVIALCIRIFFSFNAFDDLFFRESEYKPRHAIGNGGKDYSTRVSRHNYYDD